MAATLGNLEPRLMAPADVLALLDALKAVVSGGGDYFRINARRSDTYPDRWEVVSVNVPVEGRARITATIRTESR